MSSSQMAARPSVPRFRSIANRPWPLGALLMGLALAGCTMRKPDAVVPDHRPQESAIHEIPEMSWILSAEEKGSTEQMVCGSDAASSCVLTASGDRQPMLATLHLLLHPTKVDTRYSGIVRIGFGGNAYETKVNSTVKGNGAAENVTITAAVTQMPGMYTTEISLTATWAGAPKPLPLRGRVTLTIK